MANKRTFHPQQVEEYNPWVSTPLQTDSGIGIYIRQSTERQLEKNLESRGMQTNDLYTFPTICGWKQDKIKVYDEGAKSAQKRIDQRKKLQELYEDIKSDEVKTVLVVQEDRLFRDKHMTQVATFVELCDEHRVSILTPNTRYNLWKYEEGIDSLKR